MCQDSYWHETNKKREQGSALLKKTEEILGSKNNNRAKIVVTRPQCATTHKMHLCRETTKKCVVQKGTNSPKRKMCRNKETRSLTTRPRGSLRNHPNRYGECSICLLGFLRRHTTSAQQDVLWSSHKMWYECTTRHVTNVQQDSLRVWNRHVTTRRVTLTRLVVTCLFVLERVFYLVPPPYLVWYVTTRRDNTSQRDVLSRYFSPVCNRHVTTRRVIKIRGRYQTPFPTRPFHYRKHDIPSAGFVY